MLALCCSSSLLITEQGGSGARMLSTCTGLTWHLVARSCDSTLILCVSIIFTSWPANGEGGKGELGKVKKQSSQLIGSMIRSCYWNMVGLSYTALPEGVWNLLMLTFAAIANMEMLLVDRYGLVGQNGLQYTTCSTDRVNRDQISCTSTVLLDMYSAVLWPTH